MPIPADIAANLVLVQAAFVLRGMEAFLMAGAVPAAVLVGVGVVAGLGAVVFLLAGSLTLLVPGFQTLR